MANEWFWENKNVLNTGCTEPHGSWLTESLISKKANVIGLVRDSAPKSRFYKPNLSIERPYSVLEIIQKLINIMGSDLEQQLLNQSTNEIQDHYLSSKKAKKMLHWKSKYNFDNGLKESHFFQRFQQSENL
jgi:UDP-glucose 4-epimerase